VYYADNWNILDKIRRFTESGEFDSIVKDCPAFGADELRAALDYIDCSDTLLIADRHIAAR
jgi:diphthamide synthase (EF-2-diphthine--ammonia ligase)